MNKETSIKYNGDTYIVKSQYDYDLYELRLNKDKEIERLKAREQECIDKYLVESKYRSEVEGKYVVDEYIINELEKWIRWKMLHCVDYEYFPEETLDKLKALKEGK